MHLKLNPFDISNHDTNEITTLIYNADPSTYDIIFGNKNEALAIIGALLCDTKTDTIFSPPHVKVIEDNNTVIGVVVNYTGARRQTLEQHTFKQGYEKLGIVKTIKRLIAVKKVRRILSVNMDLESTYILALSIKPAHQQKGYGKKTVDELQKTSKTLYLHVNYKNNNARMFYEKIGFNKHQEFYDSYKKIPIGAIVLKRSQKEKGD